MNPTSAKTWRRSLVAATWLVLSSFAGRAAAQGEPPPAPHDPPPDETRNISDKPLEWKWSRFSTFDYVVTGIGGAATLVTAIIRPQSKPLVAGPILFDEDARSALRLHSLQDRYIVRDASDVGLSLAVTWPFFADSLFSAWWYRGSRDVAQEMALIDLETLAVSGAVQGVTNVIVGRKRPFLADCGTGTLPANALDCNGSFPERSFFSGHAAFSFTAAALVCVHHFENDLLGAPWDALSCAGGYAVAATTSTFRVMSDVHYASDVITGALVGTAIGYGIPLLHYRKRPSAGLHGPEMTWHFVPMGAGAGVAGTF
jgi:membrane-associated phospholipid phosphatase